MPRVHVLYANPVPESFGAAAHTATLEALEAGGWQVDDCDLYAEGFDPVLTTEERRGYHDVPANRASAGNYVDRLEAADALVFCFPVWNFGYPAILKGWFDRVMLPGVSFHLKDGALAPGLDRLRKVGAVTTYGATRMNAFLVGDPPRRLLTRVMRGGLRPVRQVRYVAQYDMNNIDPAGCEAFLSRVRREMGAF